MKSTYGPPLTKMRRWTAIARANEEKFSNERVDEALLCLSIVWMSQLLVNSRLLRPTPPPARWFDRVSLGRLYRNPYFLSPRIIGVVLNMAVVIKEMKDDLMVVNVYFAEPL